MPGKRGDGLELDELWSFVGSKAQTLWRWVALCRRTRQIVAWTLGERSLQSACDLRATRPKTIAIAPPAVTTGMPTPARSQKEPTVVAAKRRGKTCQVERWFGTLRARTSRLVRRAYSFSKHAENHLDAIHLFITTDNLAIKQRTTVR